jgi:AcrR family transcriptional regulator
MGRQQGLRERKRAQTRERIADVAAELFAEHGYDEVAVLDVARSADFSDQTVYNYFPAKHELVLDRAEEIRERYDRMVRDRAPGTSPSSVVKVLVEEDIARLGEADPSARGQFAALCLRSPVLRRYALEFRERQIDTVAQAIIATNPELAALVARSHAAALIAVVQWVSDQVGASVLDQTPVDAVAETTRRAAAEALDDLDRHFHAITGIH